MDSVYRVKMDDRRVTKVTGIRNKYAEAENAGRWQRHRLKGKQNIGKARSRTRQRLE